MTRITGKQAQTDADSTCAPFFVIGSVRSGTTLVERILNRHTRLFMPAETFYFTFLDRLGVLGSEGEPEIELNRVVQLYRRERAFCFLDIPPGREEEILLEGARSYRDILFNLMTFLSGRAEKPRWGEKTPNNLRYVRYIRQYFPDARFILVVRDGRASLLSRLKHPNWRRNLLGCARHWANDASVMLSLINELDDSTLHVLRYEELLEDPKQVVHDTCAFLGEAYEEAMIEPQQADGDQSRDYYKQPWMKKSTTVIDPTRATQWEQEYTPRQLRLVEVVAGEQLKALGYPLKCPAAPGWQLLYLSEQFQDVARKFSNLINGRQKPVAAARAR